MYDVFLADTRKLKQLLEAHPDAPIVFVARRDCEEELPGLLEVDSIEFGKIMNDDDLLSDGIAMLDDEELRRMIRDSMETSYDDFPERYMEAFSKEARKYKHKWKPAIIVQLGVEN